MNTAERIKDVLSKLTIDQDEDFLSEVSGENYAYQNGNGNYYEAGFKLTYE